MGKKTGIHKKTVFLPAILLLASVVCVGAAACRGQVPVTTATPVTESASADIASQEPGSKATSPVESKTLESVTEESNEWSPAETEAVPSSSIPKEVDDDVIAYRYFFGKKMMIRVADLNLKTYANEESGLFDLLSDHVFSADEVLKMIESYSCDGFTEIDGQAFTEERKAALKAYRNLHGLMAMAPDQTVSVRKAILTENADVRSFPTSSFGRTASTDPHFDLFQESKLLYATGIWILWETADKQWYFVQGENYYGWIRSTDCAVCSEEDFLIFVSPDEFLVTVSVSGKKPWNRMGVIMPFTGKPENSSVYDVNIPVRKEDGTLKIENITLENSLSGNEEYHKGFMEFTRKALDEMKSRILGAPYGWGDMDNDGRMAFDCSSTVSSVMRCFGIYMPRNSYQYQYSGAKIFDLSGMSREDKYLMLTLHPYSALVAPRHVMFNDVTHNYYSSDSDMASKHSIIHNTTAFLMIDHSRGQSDGIDKKTVPTDFYSCVRTEFEDMYSTDGTFYLDKLNLLLDFEEYFSPADKKG